MDIQHKLKIKKLLAKELDPAYKTRAAFVLGSIEPKEGLRILDAGCGRGFYLLALDHLQSKCELHGCELNPEHIKLLQKHKSEKNKFKVISGSIIQLPYPDNYFDFVICSEVLEHVPDDKLALKELNRVLKKEGRLIFTVPAINYPFLWDPLNFVLERTVKKHIPSNIHWLAGIWADHLRLYKKDDVVEKIYKSGFEIKEILTSTYAAFPFIHFLLYGVGKNLVGHKLVPRDFNRFDLESEPSPFLKIVRAPIFAVDSLNNRIKNPIRYLNILILADKK